MSALYTQLVWQVSDLIPEDKLLLLYLADVSNHQGEVSFSLAEAQQYCAARSEFAIAEQLLRLTEKGMLHKLGVQTHVTPEHHQFRLCLISHSKMVSLPVINQTPARSTPTYAIIPAPPLPEWAKKELRFNGIELNAHADLWEEFTQFLPEKAFVEYPIFRLENTFRHWLSDRKKQPIQVQTVVQGEKSSSRFPLLTTEQHCISTHDLNEDQIPEWAEKAMSFIPLQTDPLLFWRKFVLWHKARADELLSLSKLEHKLNYWLTNEKMHEDKQTRPSRYPSTTSQTQAIGDRHKLSPSERFRQQLIQQGKKPTF